MYQILIQHYTSRIMIKQILWIRLNYVVIIVTMCGPVTSESRVHVQIHVCG